MIQEFAQWIENVTAWKVGVDLFVGHLPQTTPAGTEIPDRCVLLAENTPGGVTGYLPDRVDKEIQIWNRAKTYFTARADAYALYERLHGKSNITLPVLIPGDTYLIMVLDAAASPAPIANPNARGLFEFSTNYILRIEDPNA